MWWRDTGRRRRVAGFTLIEILVVITVIAILASLVSPMVFRNVGEAKTAAARAQIEIFTLALDAYRLDNDYYPATSQGLGSLARAPAGDPAPRNGRDARRRQDCEGHQCLHWRGPYLRKSVPLDPWGREYLYRSPGDSNPGSNDLLTLGRDGSPGGTDEDTDLTSWGIGRR